MASHSTSTYVAGEGSGERAKLQLYSYCRSSCSWRVRIALNLKGLKYEYKAVNIYKGEQFNPGEHLGCTSITVPEESKLIIRDAPNEFLKLNPLGFVPVLVDDDVVVSDSFAIILYLEEKYPQHPLLPNDLQKRALNLQIANIVSSSIQPYQNISVLSYIEEKVSHDEKFSWVQNHIGKGFTAIEKLLEGTAGKYATGDEVFLADLFLMPQIYGAINRFNLDMVAAGKLRIKEWIPLGTQSQQGQFFNSFMGTKFPLLLKLNEAYDASPAFRAAMPDMQPDAVKV